MPLGLGGWLLAIQNSLGGAPPLRFDPNNDLSPTKKEYLKFYDKGERGPPKHTLYRRPSVEARLNGGPTEEEQALQREAFYLNFHTRGTGQSTHVDDWLKDKEVHPSLG